MYQITITIAVDYSTGIDPATRHEAYTHQLVAEKCLYLCESLFWLTQQLGEAGQAGHQPLNMNRFYEALVNVGELGRALTATVHRQVDTLERLAGKDTNEQDRSE